MRPVTARTFLEYRFPNRVAYNPSGSRAALVCTAPDAEKNGYGHTLMIYEGGRFRQLFPLENGASYIWDNDEEIVFTGELSEDRTVLYRAEVRAGSRQKIGEYALNVREIAGICGGVYLALCRTEDAVVDEGKGDRRKQAAMAEADVEVLEELPFCKNGEHGFVSRKRDALFILKPETGECRRVTPPFFQVDTYCIEGDTVFFNGGGYRTKMCLFQELWSYRVSDGVLRCLYDGGAYNMRGLAVWDGRLMLLGNTNPNIKLFHSDFYQVDKESGDIRLFCPYDHSIRSYVSADCAWGKPRLWASDGGRLYFISTIRNASWLMALQPDGTVIPVLKEEGMVCDFDVRGGRVFFTALYGQRLLECYCSDIAGNYRQVGRFNGETLKDRYVAVPQKHTFVFGRVEIDGWALLPMDYDPEGSFPAVLDIHGGPNSCYSEAFFHEMQVWAGRGFFVFFCNPVGSEGRGDDFMNIHGRFGQEDYACIMQFLDVMLEKYPQADRERLCVTGGSYGGFMTNWIITHSRRFAAAVSQRGIANWITTELLCDNGWYNMPPQLMGDVPTGADKLWEQSPLKYVGSVNTPTLFLHADEDYSVPAEEGMQMFSALMAMGVETRMVRFKGENHELSRSGRPLARIRRLEEIIRWMEEHI